jgi:hypothetical protein
MWTAFFLAAFLSRPVLAAEDLKPGEAPASVDARLTDVEGEVTVYSADQGADGVEGEAGMPLDAGDRVVTGKASKAEIGLEGDSIVELGPGTEFTVTDASQEKATWTLAAGSLWAKVKSAFVARHGLRVRTPTAVASVRGTEFGVEVEAGDAPATHVGVFDEGRVGVAGAEGGDETALEAGEEVSVARGARPGAKRRLERFLRHRDRMKRLRARHAKLRKLMKSLRPAERRELRKKVLERGRRQRERDNRPGNRGRRGGGRREGRP